MRSFIPPEANVLLFRRYAEGMGEAVVVGAHAKTIHCRVKAASSTGNLTTRTVRFLDYAQEYPTTSGVPARQAPLPSPGERTPISPRAVSTAAAVRTDARPRPHLARRQSSAAPSYTISRAKRRANPRQDNTLQPQCSYSGPYARPACPSLRGG